MSIATTLRYLATPVLTLVRTLDYSFQLRRFLSKRDALKLAFALNSKDPSDVPIGRKVFRMRKGTSDQFAFREIFKAETMDLEFLGCESPQTIVDCGAHIGSASIYFSLRYPTSKIIAIEPDKDNFALLQENTGDFPNITCVNAAVWDAITDVSIVDETANTTGRSVREARSDDTMLIRGITVEQIMDQYDINTIDLLKIDIEGAEERLFSSPSSQSWLKRVGILIVEPHDRFVPGCAKAIFGAVSSLEFEVFGRSDVLVFHIKK
jgi:FkbM family methyltransferase